MSVAPPTTSKRATLAAHLALPRVEAAERSPRVLALALLVAIAYAAFASGATALPAESRLQFAIAATAVAALAGLLFGRSLRAATTPVGWTGIGLLAAYAAFCGLSLAWSVAPDLTWVHLNRALSYVLVVALALVVGTSLPRAVETVALGYLAVASLVAVYALAGKVAPWLVNHTADFSRLRAPLDYWNALALFCVLAVPIALRTGADPARRRAVRLLAQATLVPLLVTIGLTYSRGGIASLVIAVAVLVAVGPERLRLLAFAGIGIAGAAPALLVAFARDDLTTDGLSIATRTDDGLILLAALAAGIAGAVAGAAFLRRADLTLALSEEGRRNALRGLGVAAAAAMVLLVAALALSERGVTGTITHEIDSFTEAKEEKENDPDRLLRTNSGNRWVWWREAGGAWWDRPLGGHGAGSFPLLHLAYRQDDLQVRQAHSVPLQLLAEVGLIGAGLALGALVLLGLAGASRVRAASARERPYAAALGAGCAAFAFHLWVDWDWDIPAVTLPLLLFLGVLAARPPGAGALEPLRPPREGEQRTGGRSAALGFGTLALVIVAVSAALPSLARDHTSEALASAADGTPEGLADGAKHAEISRRLNPLAVEPLFAGASIAERRGRFDRAADLLAEAARRQPANQQTWLRVATFDLKRDDLPRALESGQQVLRLDPRNPFPLLFPAYGDPAASSATATGTPLPQG